jgi:uncharacterized membrane protein
MEPINNPVSQDTGKTAGIISYFTIVGWLIAYFGFHQSNKTSLGSYQLRQTLLLHIVFMVVRYGLAFILGTLWLSSGVFSLYYLLWIVQIVFFVLWIIGFLGAINGEQKPIPFFGAWAQTMFAGI